MNANGRFSMLYFINCTVHTQMWRESQEILMSLIHPSSRRVSLPGEDHNMLYLNPKPVLNAMTSFLNELKRTAGK